MSGYKLYAVKTWGSAVVEMVFEHAGLPVEIEYLTAEQVGEPAYKELNPLAQIPTLRLPTGEIMTESLAICLYLESKAKAGLVPSPESAESARFLRWSVFIVGSIYSLAAFADHPDWFVKDRDSQSQLKESTMNRVKERFLILEREARGPWFLGETLSLIDLYLAVMTYWEPRREWFEAHCPRIMEIVDRYQATPVFKKVFARNTP